MKTIPKKIHYCWLSEDPYPEIIQYCLESWKKHLTDYEFILWDKRKFDITSNEWVRQAFESKKYAFAADYIRIYALYSEGGIYLDTDVEALNNFDEFLKYNFFTGFENNSDIEAAIIGSVKGHPFMKDVLNYYDNRDFIKNDGSFNMKILPVIMAILLKDKYDFKAENKYQVLLDDIHIFPSDYFSPKDVRSHRIDRTENSITIHHFNAGWIRKGILFYLKRYIHILALLFGQRFYNALVRNVRNFTGNNKINK